MTGPHRLLPDPGAVDSPHPAPRVEPPGLTGVETTGWGRLLIATGARTLLLMAVSLLFWAAVPAVLGWIPTTVFSGSMMPKIAVGDVVIARPTEAGELELGQVLLVEDPDHPDRLRLHRFESVTQDGELVLHGDANPQADSTPVQPAAVRGVGVLRVPFIGLPIVWWQQGDWPELGLFAGALVFLLWLSGRDRRPGARQIESDEEMTIVPDEPGARHRRMTSVRTRTRRKVVATLVIVAGLVVVGLRSESAYAAQTGNGPESFASIPYYTCQAAVLAASPYYFYRLDDGLGTIAADSSGNLRPGSYLAGTVGTGNPAPCPRDNTKSIAMNGSGTYITPSTLTVQNNPTTYTISIWFKAGSGAGGRLIGFGNANTGLSTSYDRMLYLTNAGQVVFGTYPGTVQTLTSAVGQNNNQWHYAVATQSSAGMRLYLDGTQVGSNAVTTAQNYSGYWRVGWDNLNTWPSQPSNYSLTGFLADAAVYTTALTPAQVLAQYQAGS